jgi:hypothetical protein
MGRKRGTRLAALVVVLVAAVGVVGAGVQRAAGETGVPATVDVQAAALVAYALRSSTDSMFVCRPAASSSNTATTQSCTISASDGVCIEVSSNPSVEQSCMFTQTNTTGTNTAVAAQVIVQRNPAQSGTETQTGSQAIEASQGNATGSNLNWSTQIVKQFLGHGADNPDTEADAVAQAQARQQAAGVPADLTSLIQSLAPTEIAQENASPSNLPGPTSSPVSEVQQSQQTINVCQGAVHDPCGSADTMHGDNVNGNYQSLRQWEWANDAPSIEQLQNADGGTCVNSDSKSLNMCSVVHQSTTGGKNRNGVFEAYRQFQRALDTSGGRQVQDAAPDLGGLGHDIFQLSVVPSPFVPQLESIETGQRARQVQRAENAGALTQAQDPHVDKGPASTQTGSVHDTWQGSIDSEQSQLVDDTFTHGGGQSQDLGYSGRSTGDVVALVRGSENGSTATARCVPGNTFDVCNAGVSCTSVPVAGKGPRDTGCRETGAKSGHEGGDRKQLR